MSHHPSTERVLQLFDVRGNSEYGHEAVTQLEHALQAAWFAEKDGADGQLIAASLLHDIGHMLHDLPDDAPEHGIDDFHENIAAHWLRKRFGDEIAEPVRLHVAAKRYLCTMDDGYLAELSEPSAISLKLQGGPMSAQEALDFEANPYFQQAIKLRHFDDAAKIKDLVTPDLEYFAAYLDEAAIETREGAV